MCDRIRERMGDYMNHLMAIGGLLGAATVATIFVIMVMHSNKMNSRIEIHSPDTPKNETEALSSDLKDVIVPASTKIQPATVFPPTTLVGKDRTLWVALWPKTPKMKITCHSLIPMEGCYNFMNRRGIFKISSLLAAKKRDAQKFHEDESRFIK